MFMTLCPVCRKPELEVGYCVVFKGLNYMGNEYDASCLHCGAIGTGPDYDSAVRAVKPMKEKKMKHAKHRRGKGKR